MQTTQTWTVTVEYTLRTVGYVGGDVHMTDIIDLDRSLKPSQIETRLAAGWNAVRQDKMEVLDLLITKVVETTQVVHQPEDRYHFQYSA